MSEAERVLGTDGVDELRIRVHDLVALETGIDAIASVLELTPTLATDRSSAVRTYEDDERSLRPVALGAVAGVEHRDDDELS